MKVDVTLKELSNAQVAAVLLLLPVPNPNSYDPLCWRVSNWSHNSATLTINNIDNKALEGLFFELNERTVVITSSRNGREGY